MVDIPELTPAERKLIAAAAKGEFADFTTGDKDRDDPANGAAWGPDRTLRAEILCLLATRAVPDWPLHWHGIQIDGARITGSIDLDGARLATRLILRQCFFHAVVRLQDSEIDFLSLQGSRLPGLAADRMVVKGGVFLRNGFHATGEVRLPGAALFADGVTVKGDVFLNDGFHATGEVRLPGADIGGDLDCSKGKFENDSDDQFVLDCSKGKFENDSDDQFVLERAKIAGALNWTKVKLVGNGTISFHLASVGTIIDDEKSWPKKDNLFLDGLRYTMLGWNSPTGWRARKDWLDRQAFRPRDFRPQPYEQLIKVLRAMGHDRDARQIAMEKQRALRRSGGLKLHERLWNCFMGVTLGYGYQPWRAVVVLFMFLVLGGIGAYCAAERGIMVPAKERVYMAATYPPAPPDYPVLDPMIYSLDVLLPIVDLHQESYWLPSVNKPYGALARWYMWLHIAVGWIFTTLAVAGFTGLVKKD